MNGIPRKVALALLLVLSPWAVVVRAEDEGAGTLPPSLFESTPGLSTPSGPDWFLPVLEGRSTRPRDDGSVVAKGRRSYNEQRADDDARATLLHAVSEWLAPDVPTDWKAPEALVDSLIVERHLVPVEVDRQALRLDPTLPMPETLYVAGYRADFSPDRRMDFVRAYEREVGDQRMMVAGGFLGFVLACLAILAGYIRADEATRGYYTNHLRLVAAVAAGAAGAAAYRWFV